MNSLIIHIGLHKTGTTFLQNNLFPALPNTSVIRGFHSHRKLMKVNPNHQIILTDEGLSGNLWKGTYLNDFYANMNRLKSIYHNPKIIFGIRNQLSFILSVYKQYLHEKGTKDLSFLYNLHNSGVLKHEELLLMPKIKFLQDNFNHLFIYSQESLNTRYSDFINEFVKFINVDAINNKINKPANVGVNTVLQVKTLKKLNKVNRLAERVHPKLSLYSSLYKSFGLTPRNISQSKLKKINSPKFELPHNYTAFIKNYYQNEWNEATQLISY